MPGGEPRWTRPTRRSSISFIEQCQGKYWGLEPQRFCWLQHGEPPLWFTLRHCQLGLGDGVNMRFCRCILMTMWECPWSGEGCAVKEGQILALQCCCSSLFLWQRPGRGHCVSSALCHIRQIPYTDSANTWKIVRGEDDKRDKCDVLKMKRGAGLSESRSPFLEGPRLLSCTCAVRQSISAEAAGLCLRSGPVIHRASSCAFFFFFQC